MAPVEKEYFNPGWKEYATYGSGGVAYQAEAMRLAGARARSVLIEAAARRFMESARAMTPPDWERTVQSAQGRSIPGSEIPWMRVREVWIHLADLDLGPGFEVLPDAVAAALVHDVAGWMDGRVTERVELAGVDGVTFGGSPGQPPVRVDGTPQALAEWLVGRSRGETLAVEGPSALPDLPRWL